MGPFWETPYMKGSSWRTPHKRCCILRRSPSGMERNVWEKVKGGDEPMTDLVWQEVGVLLASGAIGSLLVWGYQNWLKR